MKNFDKDHQQYINSTTTRRYRIEEGVRNFNEQFPVNKSHVYNNRDLYDLSYQS